MKSTSAKIDPLEIEFTAGTQSRHSINQTTIDEYAEAMRNGDLFPQIVVFAEEGSKRYILADGFHRLPAHIAAKGKEPIACEIHEGRIQDAKLYAASANADHGVRRTPMDIRHSIRMLILDGEWADRSNQWIGDAAKAHRKTVAKVLEEMVLSGEIGSKGISKKKYKRDGKIIETPVKGKKKGKDQAVARPTKSQEEYDREDILTAFGTFKTAVCSGAAAVDKNNLEDYLAEAQIARAWLDELIEELIGRKAPDGEDEFLQVSEG